MKIELSTSQAVDILLKDEIANWSYSAALALIEYYEALEEDLGEPIYIDPVAIRCDWTEYSNIEEASKAYSSVLAPDPGLEYFTERTNVIVFEGGVLVQQF
jgi:hypothetical protein